MERNSREHMLSVLWKLGLELDEIPDHNVVCPQHDDQNPSLSFFITGEGIPLVHCYSGSCALFNDGSWSNADQLDFYATHGRLPDKGEQRYDEKLEKVLKTSHKLCLIAQKIIQAYTPTAFLQEYLEEEGLVGIGKDYYEIPPSLSIEMTKALMSEGMKQAQAEKLLDDYGWMVQARDRLPYWHSAPLMGKWYLVKANCRYIDTKSFFNDDYKTSKFVTLGKHKDVHASIYLASPKPLGKKVIYLTGGEKDSDIIRYICGLNAVTIGSEGYSLAPLRYFLSRFESIYIIYDNEVGSNINKRRQAVELASHLKRGINVVNADYLSGKDTTDVWKVLRDKNAMTDWLQSQEVEIISPSSIYLVREQVSQKLNKSRVDRQDREQVAELIRAGMEKNGMFLTSQFGDVYYFHNLRHEMTQLGEKLGGKTALFLFEYGVNQAEADAKYIYNHIKLTNMNAPRSKIEQCVAINETHMFLDNGDGYVSTWEIGPGSTGKQRNGENGILFEDCACEPLELVAPDTSKIDELVQKWKFCVDDDVLSLDDIRQLYRAYLYTLPVSKAMGIRAVALNVVGASGTGKSSFARMVGQLLIGAGYEVGKLAMKEDDFWVTASHDAVANYDNVEGKVPPWAKDAIASLITGARQQKRELYTDGGVVTFQPNPYVIVTSMNGSLFRRGDLASRALIIQFPQDEMKEDGRDTDREMLAWVSDNRGVIVSTLMDGTARALPTALQHKSRKLRMADWWSLACGIQIALGNGDAEYWEALGERVNLANATYSTGRLPIMGYLKDMVLDGFFDAVSSISAGELLEAMSAKFNKDKPIKDIFGKELSAQGIGDYLQANMSSLKKLLGMDAVKDSHTGNYRYTFVGGVYKSEATLATEANAQEANITWEELDEVIEV